MKKKQPNEMEREALYQARLKQFERFKASIKEKGFKQIKVETYIVKDYTILNR